MDNVFVELFSVAVVVFCFGIAILVTVARTLVEYLWKAAKTSKLWNELILPILPIVVGTGFATVPQYPFPEMFTGVWSRMFLGMVCGFVSAHVYKIAKKWLEKKTEE